MAQPITVRTDFDGWVLIPGTPEAPNSFRVVRFSDIPALRPVMSPSPQSGWADCLPRGVLSHEDHAEGSLYGNMTLPALEGCHNHSDKSLDPGYEFLPVDIQYFIDFKLRDRTAPPTFSG